MFKKTLAGLMLAVMTSVASASTIVMTVDGLVCAFCAQGIDKRLRKIEAIQDVYVSLEKKTVAISLRDGKDISDETLRQNLTESGYSVRAISRTDDTLDAVRARTAQP